MVNFLVELQRMDPVALKLGIFSLRWYSLAYILGILLGWFLLRRSAMKSPQVVAESSNIDDVITWATIGIILGGRLGYIIFYNFSYYIKYPLDIFKLWEGGMSFHGAFLGVLFMVYWYCKKKGFSFLGLCDRGAMVCGIGIMFGRIANFINGELWGRVTDVSWGIVFPQVDSSTRHPSQLYEAVLEGLGLFILMQILGNIRFLRSRYGLLSGLFCLYYGSVRFFLENFREPDGQIGFLYFNTTLGQLLCLPLILFGIYLIAKSGNKYKND